MNAQDYLYKKAGIISLLSKGIGMLGTGAKKTVSGIVNYPKELKTNLWAGKDATLGQKAITNGMTTMTGVGTLMGIGGIKDAAKTTTGVVGTEASNLSKGLT